MHLNREQLAFGLALIVAVSLMGLPQTQKLKVAAMFTTGWSASGQWFFSRVIRFARNEAKARFLLQQNIELALDNMKLREAGWENERLRQALKFQRSQTQQQKILAEIIGRDPDQLLNVLVLNVGQDRGIEKEWPVVSSKGLVGHIVEVGPHSSIVQLILRSGGGISALVQERRAKGIATWVHDRLFKLEWVDENKEIHTGDRVITSGLGGRFLKGIVVGSVSQVQRPKRDPLFQEVFLTSEVDFWNLEEVFVLRPLPDPLDSLGM
jgi:rod shape-determining protein MreC